MKVSETSKEEMKHEMLFYLAPLFLAYKTGNNFLKAVLPFAVLVCMLLSHPNTRKQNQNLSYNLEKKISRY